MQNIKKSFTSDELKKIKDFYYSFFLYDSPESLIFNNFNDEISLGFRVDKLRESGLLTTETEPPFMLVCKSFPDSGFLKCLDTPSSKDKSGLAAEIIKNSESFLFGYIDRIEYILARGFLGIDDELMIAIGVQSAIYGFNFSSGRVGMMR